MPKSRVQRVSITVQPVPGNEPDAFEVDEGEMKAGDSFTIQIGDSSHGGAGTAVYDGTALGRILALENRR